MAFCKNCGTEIGSYAKFCEGCGMPIGAVAGVPRKRKSRKKSRVLSVGSGLVRVVITGGLVVVIWYVLAALVVLAILAAVVPAMFAMIFAI